ncbi:MAG: hypothetical protein LBS84_12605 [Clostridiales bacterium]|nr:hypothetical protein [Clostridiales bacterium]
MWFAYYEYEVNVSENFREIERELIFHNNIGDGAIPDTESNRSAVSEVLNYEVSDIKTIRIELGFKDQNPPDFDQTPNT